MYANYYDYTVTPDEEDTTSLLRLVLSCNTNTIKAGGSYKLITATLYDGNNEPVTSEITAADWTCYLDEEDVTSDDLITWQPQDNISEMRIKFAKDRSHYTEILTVKCTAIVNHKEISGEIQLEIVAL